jgi:hypothetical protein
MDHSDIYGLVTALHRSVAVRPLSWVGAHCIDAQVDFRGTLSVQEH